MATRRFLLFYPLDGDVREPDDLNYLRHTQNHTGVVPLMILFYSSARLFRRYLVIHIATFIRSTEKI